MQYAKLENGYLMKRIFDKIVGWLNGIGADKYKHFALGAVIAAITVILLACFLPKWAIIVGSVAVVAMAAIVKERIDEQADEQDIVATCLGGAVVWITYLIG